MKTVNKFYVFLTGLNGWAFVYKLNGYEIDSCCSYLNFRYRTCFELRTPWHSGNYCVYIHSKTRMRHDRHTQLKNFWSLYTGLLNYLIYGRVKASSILHSGTTLVARIGWKWFLFIWSGKSFLSLNLFTRW